MPDYLPGLLLGGTISTLQDHSKLGDIDMKGIHIYSYVGERMRAIELTRENWEEICDLDLGPGFQGCYIDEYDRPTDYVTDKMGALWPKAPGLRGWCYVMRGGDYFCMDDGPGPFADGKWFPVTREDFEDTFGDATVTPDPSSDYENIGRAQLSLFGDR